MSGKANALTVVVGGSPYEITIGREVTVAGLNENMVGWVRVRVLELLARYSPGFGDAISYVANGLRETSWVTKVDAPTPITKKGVVY